MSVLGAFLVRIFPTKLSEFISKVRYRKTSYINPWAYIIQRAFLMGFYGGGLYMGEIYEGAYTWGNNKISNFNLAI